MFKTYISECKAFQLVPCRVETEKSSSHYSLAKPVSSMLMTPGTLSLDELKL